MRKDQEWRERHGSVVVENNRAGLLARASRALDQAETAAIDHVGDQAKALAKKGLAPKDSDARRNAEVIRQQSYGTPEAERLAANDTAAGVQEFGGEAAEAGGRGLTWGAIEYGKAELGTRAIGMAVGAVGRSGRAAAQLRKNYQEGQEFDAYVRSTRLRRLEEAGQLEVQEHLPTPDLRPARQFVKPDYTIYNRANTVAAYADAKAGAEIAFDAQARGFIQWGKTSASKTVIYYTPTGATPMSANLLRYAQQNGVRILQVAVP